MYIDAVVEVRFCGITLAKEAGVPCFQKHDDRDVDCMLYRLYERYPNQKLFDWPAGFSGGIAHRLDIPTSGQLLVAADVAELDWLRRQFADKKLLKTYYFLTAKQVSWRENTITAALAHDRRKKSRMVVQRGLNTPHRGRWLAAKTSFLWCGEQGGLTLWRAQMRTGVMHQIRLHAAFAGIALAGDKLYGGGASPAFFPVPFALHHVGVEAERWRPERIANPKWWPDWTMVG